MRKKLAAVLLCMCMVLTLLPVSASAATTYYFEPVGVYVGGNDISNGGTITGAAGTVSFSSGTLTLNNAKITGATDFHLVSATSSETQDKAGIYISPALADPSGSSSSKPYTLTIELVGDNVIEGQAGSCSSYGIYAENTKLVFTGNGTLKVTSAAITCNRGDTIYITHRSIPIRADKGIEIGANCTIVAASGGFVRGENSHCYASCNAVETDAVGGLVLNGTTAVFSEEVGGTTTQYDPTAPTTLNGKKYMKIGTGTVPNDPADTGTGDDQTPPTSTTPTVTITYANGATVTAPKVGETLYAKVTNAPENTTLTYLWGYNDGAVSRAFSNATNDTYTLGADAVGKKILVQVRDNSTQQGEPLCQYVIGTAVVAADSTTPTPNPATPTTPATGNHYRVFHVDAEKAESPKTADTGVMLYAALSLASLTGTAWWSKKRK